MDARRRDELKRRRAELLEERRGLKRRLGEFLAEFERRDRRTERTSIGFGIGGLVLAPFTGGWSAAASLVSLVAAVRGVRRDDWDRNRVLWIEGRLDEIADELADIALEAITGEQPE